MMKAFSFLTILESLSKKLSILRTKMHSDDLRVDYESITSQLRVNPLFSHCASRRTSFALSRRASHFAAILTILFTVGVGNLWGENYVIYQATSGGVNTSNVEKTEISFVFNKMKEVTNSPVISVKSDTYGIEAGLKAPRFGGSSNGNNIKFVVKNGYIATVTAYVQTNSEKKNIAIQTTEGTPNNTDIAYVSCEEKGVVYKIEATNLSAGEYYIKASSDAIGVIKLIATVIASSGGGEETKHTVSFDTHGGGNVDAITQSSAGAAITLPAAPTKTGYTFVGWYTAATGGTKAGDAGASYTPTATITLHAQWTAEKYDVTHTLSNVTRSSGGEAGDDKATYNIAYSVVFLEEFGYIFPENITVQVGSTMLTAGTDYTWTKSTGTLTIPANKVTGNITITINAVAGGGDVYYLIPNSANVADRKLKTGSDGTAGIYKTDGNTICTTTEISATNTGSNAGYYNSTSLEYSEFTKLSNYGTGSSSSRTMRGIKLASGKSIEIDPKGKTFSQLDVIYRCASSEEKSITIAGETCNTNDQNFHLKTITKTFSNSITISNSSGKEYNLFIILKEQTCTAPTLSYATTAVTKTFGDAAFTNTLTNTNGVAVTYSSTNENVATVANNGQVTIVGAGETTIKATWAGNATYCEAEASYTLTVNKANISPTLTYNPNSLAIGGTANPNLTGNTGNGTVTYSSSNTSVATVNQNGVVTAVAEGTATITATIDASANYNGATTTCQISVHCTAPTSVTIDGAWDKFGGETISLKATATGGSGNYTYQWKHNGENIEGATEATYTKDNCTLEDGGNYSCVVSTGETCSKESSLFGLKVYTLECYTDGETKYDFKREGTAKKGSVQVTLANNKQYEFKINAGGGAEFYFGNNGTINADISNWTFEKDMNNVKLNSGLGGTFVFTIDYTDNGNVPKISVTYPRKTIYLVPNSDWSSNSAKFAFYYYGTSGTGWTDFLTSNDCGMSAEIPQWNGLNVIAVRFNPSDATPGWNGNEHVWNQTGDIAATADKNCVTITGWNTGTYGTYSTPTYTISYNAGTGGSGSKPNETKTCGVDFTLPNSAVFTRTGYTQTGWTTSDGGSQTHALGGSYTTNAAQTFYPVWTVNSYQTTTTFTNVSMTGEAPLNQFPNTLEYGSSLNRTFVANTGYRLPETITVTGATYTWDSSTGVLSITNVTGEVSVTITGVRNTYTITYNINRPTKYENDETETDFPAQTTVTVNAGGTITLPNPSIKIETITVYTAKWKDASDNEYSGGAEITPTGDMTLTAQWTPQSWPIRYYESFDGTNLGTEITGLTPNQYTYGVETEFCAEAETIVQKANKTGYTWLGWWNRWDIPEPQNPITTATAGYSGEFSLFAKWEEESVTPDPEPECETTTITYNLEIEGQNASQESTSDKITNLIGATPTGSTTTYSEFKAEGYTERYSASVSNNDVTTDGVIFRFDVPIGYVFKPSAISTNLLCYGWGQDEDDGTQLYKFYGTLSDGATTINGTVDPEMKNGADADIVYSDIADKILRGTVTLRLNAVRVAGNQSEPSFRIKSPITITGQLCETQTYTISYNANGGSGTMESTTNVVAANTFTREGYTFAGWNTVADGTGTSYAAGDYISSDLTLYAQWTENTPVTPPTQGGEVCVTFEGSSNAISYTSGVFAMYVADSNGRIYTDEESWATGKTDCSGSKVYAFDDNRFLVKVSVPITSIHFSGYSSSERTIESVKTSTTADKGSYSKPALVGDTKIGPTTGCQEFKINFSEAIPANTYIWVELSNAMVISTICYTPAPSTPSTYTVTYKANGGTGDDVTSKVAVVGACPNSFTAPTGKTFKGWNTAADGTGTAYAVGAEVQSDLTLYAQWGVAYTVTYNANGATSGTAPKDNNKYFSGDQVSVLGNISNMTKTNHSFVGWNTQANGSGAAYTAGSKMTMPADNVTLYAVWNNEKCGENYVTWTLPTNNKEFESFSTTQDGLTATASPTNSAVTVASDAKEDLTTKLVPTAETSYLEFKFAVPSGSQFTPCELTLPVQPITSACNFTITVTDGTNTLTRTFTNCAHGSITTLTMNNTSTITFTGDVSIKIYSTGTTHGYRLGSPLSIFGAVVNVQNPCTTPVLPTLAATTVCEGENVSWNAAITNELADGETVEYKWVKSPNTSTILATTAQYQIANATEAATGTYIVSATVSAEGKNRTIAHTQVRLTVTPTTATPTITADKDKVYEGNSVTLTAATASTGVNYQWYTCTNAEGAGETIISGATSASYTITSAGAAGTHYYKVRVSGDGTHSCGTAEAIFPLVVSSSNSGQTTCAEIAGQFASGVYNLDTDFVLYGVNNKGNLDTGVSSTQGTSRCGGEKGWFLNRQRFAVTFPVNVVSFSFMGYQSNDRTIENVKTTAELLSEDTEYQTIKYTSTVTKENNCQTFVVTPENTITAGTIVWIDLSNALNISEICYVPYSDVACTDPDVTATVDNATICEGGNESTVTFTATGAADGTTFQWQKKDGNNWEGISGATSATYTIPSVAENAGKYRVVATKGCNRISNELTLNVLTPPAFGTITTYSVMQTTSLVIDDVEAIGATSYAWYKSADATFNSAEDTQIGNTQDLMISSVAETAGSTFYLFCLASNSCGTTESQAITVTVTELVEEECATKGNEGSADFFTFVNTGCGNKEIESKKVWSTSSRNKYLTYTTIEGKYFATAKVQIAHSASQKAAYAYFTDGGTNWTYVEIPELSASLATYTITFPANVNAFRIGRNFTASDGEKGSTSGNFYLHEACFTYKNACTATTLTPDNASPEYTMGGDADFTEPTFTLKAGETPLTPDNGAITYSSSNTAIATVESNGNVHFEGMTGSVTITATYAGGTIGGTDYCECTGSYTITVSCQDEDAPIIVAANGTNMSECNASITLEVKKQDKTTDFESGSYQWYRNGVAIDGATAKAYTATQSGTYTVVHYGKCDQWSTNKAVITNDNSEPSVERLAPFQYYHVDKTYSDQMKDRHLFAVKSYGRLDNGKRYQLSATRNGSPWDISTSTSFFVITSADNAVDTIMLDLNQMKGKFTEGDNIVITCNPVNSCNALSTISESITIKVIDQTPTLALICSGAKADGSGTRTTDQMTVGGDFLTGYNPADLCQQTENRAFDATKEWGFYTVLKENYIVVPVNGYATFNKLNYEPFDILLLTDYPKTGHSEAAQKIIDDMSDLCDYRPLLSFKTHFQSTNFVTETGEFKYNKWTKKGFTTAPVVPAQPALYADIVCYAHPMFEAISDVTASEDFYHNADDHDQLVYKILSQAGHEGSKGMQGFELADAANFVTIGLIHNDASAAEVTHDNHEHVKWTSGANDRQLVAIAERQANIEARMILFSINCGAQSMQTEGGRQVILQCLKYLYDPEVTDPELIVPADCHLTFDNGAGNTEYNASSYTGTGEKGDGLWSTAANWAPGYKVCPTANSDVRIAAPCTVDIADAEALSVQIVEGGSLIIGQGAALNVTGPITRFDKATSTSSATESEDIFIGSDEKGNGTLIFNNDAGNTKATVEMYSTAKADTDTYSAAASTWQYIGTPHSDVQNAVTNYYNSWLYQYGTETQSWEVIPNGGPLVPFKGYCITHPETPHTYTMTGTLVTTTSQSIDIPASKYVVVANSWTAPIQVANFADADLENITEKTVYLFNTGSDPEGDNDITTPETAESTSRYAANTYVAMPIHAATYIGCSTIPSMQGFYVVGGETDGQLHLDYDQLVRPQTGQSIVGEQMHAPARRVAADDEPQVAKFLFRGKRYDDRLIILERPDFTRGYDSGWDGEQWGGNAAAPMSYVVTETRWDAVSAIPEYEGTVIAFRAGEDSEYTIHFDYDGMEDALYLLDTDTQIYTRVLKGNSYTFTCTDKAEHNRFILTRKAPQIATGTEHINTGENAKAVKFIKDDKIFIFVNGMLYDATGKTVIR